MGISFGFSLGPLRFSVPLTGGGGSRRPAPRPPRSAPPRYEKARPIKPAEVVRQPANYGKPPGWSAIACFLVLTILFFALAIAVHPVFVIGTVICGFACAAFALNRAEARR